MSVTPEDIETEHNEALKSLTKEQRWALARVQRAWQEARYDQRRIDEHLQRIFEAEAQRRSRAEILNRGDLEADAHRATD